jgi:hypothetical protein
MTPKPPIVSTPDAPAQGALFDHEVPVVPTPAPKVEDTPTDIEDCEYEYSEDDGDDQ